jgi:hypothetical protein
VRFRFVIALVVAMLSLSGIAFAQTSEDPTSGYTTTTPTTPAETTPTEEPEAEGEEQSGSVPEVAAQPAGEAPRRLAFTGAEPILFILGGMVVAGTATTLLVRDRRRATQGR